MKTAVFQDYIARTSSDGNPRYLYGSHRVYCDVIPADAPQDWSMGPELVPGEYGIFFEHLYYPERHGPYAVVTGKTEDEAIGKAAGMFRAIAGADGKVRSQAPGWTTVEVEERRAAAA